MSLEEAREGERMKLHRERKKGSNSWPRLMKRREKSSEKSRSVPLTQRATDYRGLPTHQVKVMELSDALESSGSYSRAEISERLQKYRDRLMQESVEPSRSPRQQKTSRRSRSPSPSTLGVCRCESFSFTNLLFSHSYE